jgi:hypothetical protein
MLAYRTKLTIDCIQIDVIIFTVYLLLNFMKKGLTIFIKIKANLSKITVTGLFLDNYRDHPNLVCSITL